MIQIVTQISISGLTLGAMYALSTASLSLIWGALNVLNMAQGALLAFGGYVAYSAIVSLGMPSPAAIGVSIVFGGILGWAMYITIVRQMLNKDGFEVNVVIATVGIGTVLENTLQKSYGAYPLRQPVAIDGGFFLLGTHVPFNSVVILIASAALMSVLAVLLSKTRMGRAIRAVSQNKDAARLMGVPVQLVFAQVFVLAGALSAASGIMLSTITTLAPTMGYDPMLKAFIVCVIAGLGNVPGALLAAIGLGLAEATIQFLFGVRFAFPGMLMIVILILIWKPQGLFGLKKVVRQ